MNSTLDYISLIFITLHCMYAARCACLYRLKISGEARPQPTEEPMDRNEFGEVWSWLVSSGGTPRNSKPEFVPWINHASFTGCLISTFRLLNKAIFHWVPAVSWWVGIYKCGPVLSWFINHSNYMVISTINYSYWSYVHQLSYRKRGPHFVSCLPASLYHKDGRMDFFCLARRCERQCPWRAWSSCAGGCAAVQLCSKRWI